MGWPYFKGLYVWMALREPHPHLERCPKKNLNFLHHSHAKLVDGWCYIYRVYVGWSPVSIPLLAIFGDCQGRQMMGKKRVAGVSGFRGRWISWTLWVSCGKSNASLLDDKEMGLIDLQLGIAISRLFLAKMGWFCWTLLSLPHFFF